MLDPSSFFTFYAAVLALQLAPGPDMLLVMGRGIGLGRRVAVLTATGTTLLATLVQLPLLVFGIASLIQAHPLLLDLLRWGGAASLIWLGLGLLITTMRPKPHRMTAPQPVADAAALRQGMMSNLTNPKPMIFMLAFLPQFVDPSTGWPVAVQLLVLGAVQKLSGFFVLTGVALGAGTFGGWPARHPKLIVWQERFAGAVMVGLGLRLALSAVEPRASR